MARKQTFRERNELTDEELKELYYPISQKTGKKYKKSVGFRVRDNESVTLLRWIECQTNFSESVRYLIEKQLLEDGEIKDFSKPRDLDELFEKRINRNHETVSEGDIQNKGLKKDEEEDRILNKMDSTLTFEKDVVEEKEVDNKDNNNNSTAAVKDDESELIEMW